MWNDRRMWVNDTMGATSMTDCIFVFPEAFHFPFYRTCGTVAFLDF